MTRTGTTLSYSTDRVTWTTVPTVGTVTIQHTPPRRPKGRQMKRAQQVRRRDRRKA